jgi:DNA processing protein
MDERHLLDAVALLLASGVGSRSAKLLVDRFGSATSAFTASRAEIVDSGLKPDQADALFDPTLGDRAWRELEAARRLGADVVPLGSPDYPALLAMIYDPPAVLFGRGAWRAALEAGPVVAMVGSRRASTYGRNVTERLAADLAVRGVTVLSGLARGIDAVAHAAAVAAGGRSIAVMGTGLDAVYPRENARLADRLLERGGVVTEFPTATPPSGQNFPFRNRVISGLALGVLVVEAAERSGSLITARMAAEQGRDVYAVPGNVTSANSFGPNHLIKDGAVPVLGWRDVVDALPTGWRESILAVERLERQAPAQQALAVAADVSANERLVLRHLATDAPRQIDALVARTRLDAGSLADALLSLELKGLAAALPGGFYVRRL